ncbi:pPIWI_RE module domain-containing protein [Aneurinibacillus aneurinilyticus]|jgi:hypothetical protein|uniref:pPIWI_RE module domain-containing protein n=1 Tax=Aneurinibacillus aneurinilyticus TaxID=1391 RepID=UPI0023F9E3D9|nr:DUF3962 domain-containing protein [Aneurinibacillus aneurinilyticus]MCI1696505.1 DUF3962 domain-containing protein [Aneurinibacillus aneurinilyticus]
MTIKTKKKRTQYIGNTFALFSLKMIKNLLDIPVTVVYFPTELYEALQLQAEERYYRVKLKKLHDYLHVFFPDLLYAVPLQYHSIQHPWLLFQGRFNPSIVEAYVKTWVEKELPACKDIPLSLRIEQQFIQVGIKMNDRDNPEFTCSLPHVNEYQILQRHIVSQLHGLSIPIVKESGEIREHTFIRVVTDKGAELISWEPMGTKDKYSYKLQLTLQTIPFDSAVYLNIHPKTIRWSSHTATREKKTKIHAYLRFPDHIQRGITSSAFVQMEWNKYNWDEFFVSLLSVYGFKHLLPTCEQIKTNTQEWLNPPPHSFTVGIPYGSHLKFNHDIGAGVPVKERAQFADGVRMAISEKFSGVFQPSFEVVKRVLKQVQRSKYEKKSLSLPSKCEYHIFYQNEALREKAVEALTNSIDPIYVDQNCIKAEDGTEITIKFHDILTLVGENGLEISTPQEELDLIKKVEQALSSSTLPSVSLVELHNKEEFDNKRDPKEPLRTAFATRNRLTQFITPLPEVLETKDKMRIRHAVEDGLRQLGAFKLSIKKMTDVSTAHVGVYFDKTVPILSAVVDDHVWMYVPTITKDWVPYYQGQLLLRKANKSSKWRDYPKPAPAFLYQALVLLERKFNHKHTIIYTIAQNTRSQLSCLNNNQLQLNEDFQLEGRITKPHWSFVRIRKEDGGQVPEWSRIGKIQGEDMEEILLPQSLSSGVLQMSERVFYSLGGKPSTQKKPTYLYFKEDREKETYRKETAFEVCIVKHTEHLTPLEHVEITHLCRTASLQFDDYTAFPLPLHMAIKAAEYTLG